jgi:hypothetical protein
MHYDLLHPLMCYDASFVVFVVLKLLADLLDFQEFVFYWVCQVFLVYFWEIILEELISKSLKASKECHMSFDNRMIAENF